MKNKEKFAKEILDIACSWKLFAVSNEGKVAACDLLGCDNCQGIDSEDCRKFMSKWAESEYQEPLVISKKDLDILNVLQSDFKYLAKSLPMIDKDERLFAYKKKPFKQEGYSHWTGFSLKDYAVLSKNILDWSFPMIKITDKEPWLIEDLKKLKVVDSYE